MPRRASVLLTADTHSDITLTLKRATAVALEMFAALGLRAADEFALIPNTSTAERSLVALREGMRGRGDSVITLPRNQALALERIVEWGMKGARAFGLGGDFRNGGPALEALQAAINA